MERKGRPLGAEDLWCQGRAALPRKLVEAHQGMVSQGLFFLEEAARLLKEEETAAGLFRLRQALPCSPGPTLASQGKGDILETALDVLRSLLAALGPSSQGPLPPDGRWRREAHSLLNALSSRIGGELRRERRARIQGLYVILDPQVAAGEPLEVARGALEGGARVIQLRDKKKDKGEVLALAYNLRQLCQQYGALFLVNDHADLALISGADGLHVGQKDLPVAEARRVLGPSQIVGRSNALLEEALESQARGADYIAVGSIFPTSTKEDIRLAGLETLRRVKEEASVPVVAIGGIHQGNVEQVIKAGADAVCVLSAVVASSDPKGAAELLVEKITKALEER